MLTHLSSKRRETEMENHIKNEYKNIVMEMNNLARLLINTQDVGINILFCFERPVWYILQIQIAFSHYTFSCVLQS